MTSWYPENCDASNRVPPGYQRVAGRGRNVLERREPAWNVRNEAGLHIDRKRTPSTCISRAPAPRANDNSKITVTGSGTFQVEDGKLEEATGGGSWTTFDASNVGTGSGTYRVTGAVRWEPAPGTPPLPNDNIGNRADTRAGLAVLRIRYSDGSAGILVVSCHLLGTPDSVFEGITASKGFADYWNREAPPAPPGNANRTVFHATPGDEE